MSDVQPGASAAASAEQSAAASNDTATAAQAATNDGAEQASQEPATGNNQQQTEQNGEQGGEQVADKPETFDRSYVEQLRKEAAQYRTKAKEVEETKAGELDAFKQEMAKALGLVEDDTDDPAKLLEAATKREQDAAAERDKASQQLREYKQRDAIRSAADTAKVSDPKLLEAVLKSDNAFNELEINADDYADQVSQRIAAAIESHPALAQVAPSASGVDTSTTNTGANRRITAADLENMSSREVYEAQKSGKLDHLL